jgi:hypothetical protein
LNRNNFGILTEMSSEYRSLFLFARGDWSVMLLHGAKLKCESPIFRLWVALGDLRGW